MSPNSLCHHHHLAFSCTSSARDDDDDENIQNSCMLLLRTTTSSNQKRKKITVNDNNQARTASLGKRVFSLPRLLHPHNGRWCIVGGTWLRRPFPVKSSLLLSLASGERISFRLPSARSRLHVAEMVSSTFLLLYLCVNIFIEIFVKQRAFFRPSRALIRPSSLAPSKRIIERSRGRRPNDQEKETKTTETE
jgi:hypothetical protein